MLLLLLASSWKDEICFPVLGLLASQDALEEKLIPNGPPSLIGCKKLVIEGGPTARSRSHE